MIAPVHKTELLSPAGTIKNMRYAFAYGADAVYAGQPRYSLRVRNNDFKDRNLEIGISEAHALGKKFYLTSNLMPHNSKVKTYIRDLEPVIELGPDALIMADPGLIMMVKERWPDMPIHLSVQANTVNYAAVKFWQREGIERVILSRELSLDEVEEIRQQCPDMELEVFVHGALCIAYSGRCLLSGYFNHRDPNQGTCTNSCRWEYSPVETVATNSFAATGLEFGMDYYWRVDEVNEADPNRPWKGDVWSFSIPPKTAYHPNPAEGTEVADSNNVNLSWTPGFGAILHTVYLGNDYDEVNAATVGTPQGAFVFR